MGNPTLNPAVLLITMEDGYVAYDTVAEQIHQLNAVASLIVELCDGSRGVEEICAMVTPILPQGSGADVQRWIEDAAGTGLLSWGGDPGNAHREPSAEELHKVSVKLRNRKEEQIAIVCQRRATELAPANADYWYDLGELAFELRYRDEARTAYEKYMELTPNDAEVKHLLVALRGDPPPPRAPDEAMQQMYADFSRTFDKNLCTELGYKGPEQLRELIAPLVGERRDLQVLDLGCGTGLAGVQFKAYSSGMTGVDISPEMVELARARNLYDRLEVAEITGWLQQCSQRFNLVLACDCLIYFGDLRQVTLPVADRLCPKGMFAFTLELGERYPHRLTDTGRYAHHPDHVREVAAEAKLNVALMNEAFLRTEYGEPVTGLFVVLEK